MDGVRKVWGKEGYLLKKESKSSNPESISPPLESGISLGEDEEHPGISAEQSLELISEEEQEKKQLASSLFVGLGSSAISLVSAEFRIDFLISDKYDLIYSFYTIQISR